MVAVAGLSFSALLAFSLALMLAAVGSPFECYGPAKAAGLCGSALILAALLESWQVSRLSLKEIFVRPFRWIWRQLRFVFWDLKDEKENPKYFWVVIAVAMLIFCAAMAVFHEL